MKKFITLIVSFFALISSPVFETYYYLNSEITVKFVQSRVISPYLGFLTFKVIFNKSGVFLFFNFYAW